MTDVIHVNFSTMKTFNLQFDDFPSHSIKVRVSSYWIDKLKETRGYNDDEVEEWFYRGALAHYHAWEDMDTVKQYFETEIEHFFETQLNFYQSLQH